MPLALVQRELASVWVARAAAHAGSSTAHRNMPRCFGRNDGSGEWWCRERDEAEGDLRAPRGRRNATLSHPYDDKAVVRMGHPIYYLVGMYGANGTPL